MQKLILGIVSLMICVILSPPTNAADIQKFSDVSPSSRYYTAVDWASDKGIISGTSKGMFAPDRKITSSEFMAILMRAYHSDDLPCGDAKDPDWANSYVGGAQFLGLLSENDYELLQEKPTRQQIWSLLMNEADLCPYSAWIYDKSTPQIDFDKDIAAAMIMTGLYPSDVDIRATPSRGEVINLMYRLEHHQYLPQSLPANYSRTVRFEMESPETAWVVRNSAMYDLSKIPQKFIDAFNLEEWKIRITPYVSKYYPNEYGAAGLCDGKNKTITLRSTLYPINQYVVVHEMGHAIMYITDEEYFESYMYQETDLVAKLVGTDYCKTNKHENFAEAFRYIITNSASKEKMQECEQMIPYTYHCIVDGYLSPTVLYSLDTFNQITQQYWEYLNN